MADIDLDTAISEIKAALKRRSPKSWSVTGVRRGTAYGHIYITAPPSRRNNFGTITEEENKELHELFGISNERGVIDCDGISIMGWHNQYEEYIDRANGRTPRVYADPPDWD